MSVQTSVALAPAIAFAGQIADGVAFDAITLVNAEASVSMPFGAIVAYMVSSPTSDKAAILPAASTARLAGVLLHKHNYERTWTMPDGSVAGELDSVGLVVGVTFSCMMKGHVYVTCEGGCVVGDKLWVRYATGTLGAARSSDAGSSTCIDATTRGTWLSIAADAKIAKLAVDFLSK